MLCSKYSDARQVVHHALKRQVELIAIDMEQVPSGLLPHFETSSLLAGTRFDRRADTSSKRNLGILIARMIGWQRLVFLDDDIVVPDPADLRKAAALTDRYACVGLSVDGYPDNSVVCHAYRLAGGPQDSFIGGGALAVRAGATTSFFPDIYNEDWFFLLDGTGLLPTAVTGRVIQKPYNPFARDERARTEEFGDCLAEGLFWLLDEGRSLEDADATYWDGWLRRRVGFIEDVMAMVGQMKDAPDRSRMLSSLSAARGRCLFIKPTWCAEYIHAWKADRVRWRRHLKQFQPSRKGHLNPEKVLAKLGLTFQARYLQQQVLDQNAAGLGLSSTVAGRQRVALHQ